MDMTEDPPGDKRTSSRWWIPIGVLVVIVPILLVSLILPPDAYTLLLTGPLTLVGITLVTLSPVFVYYDRRYLTTTSRWEPSGLYYLMFLPLLGYVLSILYIYNRHKHLGVP